ncbi:MAG TPA: cytochrome c [Xanthobacteraceae bacterium]|nr:cytochrome c [Xanthobacteraceae bacterium]
MLRRFVIEIAIVAVLGGGGFWILTVPQTVPASALGQHEADLANGRTVFIAGGCSGCHAVPGADDKTRLGGGLALKSPFGTFYMPNISSDRRDGIGAWSEAEFVTALSQGTSPDGRHYYPAFPYTSYQRMRPDDLRDLFAYLKTLPAVSGKVREHDMSFPFSFRRGLGLWKLLYLDGKPFAPDPTKSAMLNRGAYLVEGAGHCAECHSPRNLIGGIIAAQRFAGGPNPEGKGWIPNITQKDLGEWSEKDIAYLLETGQTPDGDSIGGAMTEVVRHTSQLAPEDRAAIAAYIKSLPPVEGPKPTKK